MNELRLISGSGHPELSKRIAQNLGTELVKMEIDQFEDGELRMRRIGDVRGSDLFFINSLHSHNGKNPFLETLFLMSSVIGSANKITGIFPFFGYGKAETKKRYGEVVGAKVLADHLSIAGFNHILLFDPHKTQIANYFTTINTPLKGVENLFLMRLLIEYVENNLAAGGVVGLDEGGYKRNSLLATYLKKRKAFIDKHRDADTLLIDFKKSRVIGNVRGKIIASFDDLIQSGDTVANGVLTLKHKGAKAVYILVVHPDFSAKTFKRLNPLLADGTLDGLIVVDTIPIDDRDKWHKNLTVLDPAPLIAQVITHLHEGQPLRPLFLQIE